MNMQDAKNLTIPEGSVKMIHDGDSRILWGAVGYNTKYNGDVAQQTYSGKNLIDLTLYSASTSAGDRMQLDILEPNSISLATLISNNYANWRLQFDYSVLGLSAGDTLAFDCDAVVSESGLDPSIRIAKGNSGAGADIMASWKKSTGAVTFTLPSDVTSFSLWFYANQGTPAASVGTTVSFSKVQLERGSSATQFEPYVGGIPSPNPDYPQDIQVVTGAQMVTIGDSIDSEAFPVSLGSLELCKIGTYKDYIYRSGDSWYVHKAVGNVVLTGSAGGYNANSKWYYVSPTVYGGGSAKYDIAGMKCDHFMVISYTDTSSVLGCSISSDSSHNICLRDTSLTNLNGYKNWLSSNNTTVYYPLATATDTQITDTTLISQLDAVHQWLTRYGYNATVSGNLPLIVDRTNL